MTTTDIKDVPKETVNHPPHYKGHPSGIECITITEHMGFNLGNAVKYIWRCDLKKDAIEDLRKALWYIQREIDKRSNEKVLADIVKQPELLTCGRCRNQFGKNAIMYNPIDGVTCKACYEFLTKEKERGKSV